MSGEDKISLQTDQVEELAGLYLLTNGEFKISFRFCQVKSSTESKTLLLTYLTIKLADVQIDFNLLKRPCILSAQS